MQATISHHPWPTDAGRGVAFPPDRSCGIEPARPLGAAASPKLRIHLASVASPIIAEVAERTPSGVTLRQPLPFLGAAQGVVDETGRRARIVDLRLGSRGGVPHLELELEYDSRRGREATVPFGVERFSNRPPRLPPSSGPHEIAALAEGAAEERVSSERVELYEPWRDALRELRGVGAAFARLGRHLGAWGLFAWRRARAGWLAGRVR